MHRIHLPRRLASMAHGMIALALAAALVAACGGGSATPSVSSAPDGAATCANAATLKTAVQALDAIDVMTVSNTDMKAAIDAVASATDQLIASAQKSIAQELDDLEGAVNVLEAAYEEASSGTIAQSAVPIKAAIADVDTSAIAVDASLKSSCP